ncbi:MAG: hypothetical protein JWN42_1285 [Candidatus Angelobacter sp.]|nr:hypothetical protein [Candidatus Angelobacter sp.]
MNSHSPAQSSAAARAKRSIAHSGLLTLPKLALSTRLRSIRLKIRLLLSPKVPLIENPPLPKAQSVCGVWIAANST